MATGTQGTFAPGKQVEFDGLTLVRRPAQGAARGQIDAFSSDGPVARLPASIRTVSEARQWLAGFTRGFRVGKIVGRVAAAARPES